MPSVVNARAAAVTLVSAPGLISPAHPILRSQTGNPGKVFHVPGHQESIGGHGDGGDAQVRIRQPHACAFQCQPDLAVALRRGSIEVEDSHSAEQANCPLVQHQAIRLAGAVGDFAERDRSDRLLGGRNLLQSRHQARRGARPHQLAQRIGVEDDHLTGNFGAGRRR
jgi:hypothetical protein